MVNKTEKHPPSEDEECLSVVEQSANAVTDLSSNVSTAGSPWYLWSYLLIRPHEKNWSVPGFPTDPPKMEPNCSFLKTYISYAYTKPYIKMGQFKTFATTQSFMVTNLAT